MDIGIRTLDIACLAVFAALAVGGGFVVVKTANAKADRLDREKNAVQVQLAELGKGRVALSRLNVVLNANKAALDSMMKRLPETEQIGDFLAEFDALAAKASVGISKVAQGQSVREEICTRTPISLSCQGSFESLHALLYGLENMNRIVRVERVSINRASLAESCRMDIACSVYGR